MSIVYRTSFMKERKQQQITEAREDEWAMSVFKIVSSIKI